MNWNRFFKNRSRSMALEYSSSDQYDAIMLPSQQCLDLQQGLGTTFGKGKRFHFLERNAEYSRAISNFCDSNEITNYRIYRNIRDIQLSNSVDYAFFDFMGSMNEEMYDWFKDVFCKKIADRCFLTFNFSYLWRPRCLFLESKLDLYEKSGILNEVSDRYGTKDPKVVTYLKIFEELFSDFKILKNNKLPYYYYRDNVNSMMLFRMEKKMSKSVANSRLTTLIDSYPTDGDRQKMGNWKRRLANYCRTRSQETGTDETKFRAAVKMRLTKLGHDSKSI